MRIRDLARAVFGSVGGTHYHVAALRRKGWVSGDGSRETTGTLVPRVRCFYSATPAGLP